MHVLNYLCQYGAQKQFKYGSRTHGLIISANSRDAGNVSYPGHGTLDGPVVPTVQVCEDSVLILHWSELSLNKTKSPS